MNNGASLVSRWEPSVIVPVILAGGAGSRLWPVSRADYPKQFHALASSEPLLVETARRVSSAPYYTPPLIVAKEENRFAVAAAFESAKLAYRSIVLEPEGRSTAPAAAAAAHLAIEQAGPEALLLVMPSDHLIANTSAFLNTVNTGLDAARGGFLAIFGVKAAKPEPGYGYVKIGSPRYQGVFAAALFVEKPSPETAASFCAQPGFYWNSGIFLFSARAFLAELGRFEPEIVESCFWAIKNAFHESQFIRLSENFRECSPVSIDYAVMEKTDKAVLIPLDAGWSDIGNWDSLFEAAKKDANANARSGDVLIKNSSRCYVRSEHKMVVVSGIEDLIVISTKDATLVMKRSESGLLKDIVLELAAAGRNEAEHYLTSYRPWGHFETLYLGERYHVKQIVVNPGESLSLQRHHHRAEHWIVVTGTARVRIEEEIKILTENQSAHVPLGAVHRLENPGLIPLTLIEVQSGSYLGEDDIVRLEDAYART